MDAVICRTVCGPLAAQNKFLVSEPVEVGIFVSDLVLALFWTFGIQVGFLGKIGGCEILKKTSEGLLGVVGEGRFVEGWWESLT